MSVAWPPVGSFEVKTIGFQPWAKPMGELSKLNEPEPAYRSDQGLKRLFGIEWAKNLKPFEAALVVFGDNTNAALWVSWNWITDPVVIAAKDAYNQNTELNEKLLDKDQLAARLLKFAEEKDVSGRFYVLEGKDRLAAYKLFAEIQGFIGKFSIDASTNSFTNNELKITLVKPDTIIKKETKIIEQEAEIENNFPIDIKLVSSAR